MPNLSPELLDVVAMLEERNAACGDIAARAFAEGDMVAANRVAGIAWELRRIIQALEAGGHVGAYARNTVVIGAHERAQKGEG